MYKVHTEQALAEIPKIYKHIWDYIFHNLGDERNDILLYLKKNYNIIEISASHLYFESEQYYFLLKLRQEQI